MEHATAEVTKQVSVFCSEKSKPPQCSDCQALQYKCTECRHQGEKENDVINQIKNKHKAIYSLANVRTPVSASRKKPKHIFLIDS